MKKINDISEELRSIGSSLADMPRVNPYSVPGGFFENFAGATQIIIKELNEVDQQQAWGKALPYTVPANYFETLADEITVVAIAGHIVSFLPDYVPFKTPAGYFESLPGQMLAAAKAADTVKKETKIIPLRRTHYLRPVKWAAAAILILGIGLGSYNILLREEVTQPEQMLASVSGNEIQDYLQHTYRLDIDRVVSNNDISNIAVDNKDIIQYLNETGWDATE